MSAAIYLMNPGQRDYTADAARTAGEILRLEDGIAGVVKTTLASGDLGAVYTEGIVRVLCAAATEFEAGDPVVWDVSASLGIKNMGAIDDFLIGVAVAASDGSTAYVDVDLNNIRGLEMFTETLTTAAPAATPWGTSIIDSGDNAVDATLAAGLFVGQRKFFVMQDASNSSTVAIANHVTSDPESATFDAVDEMLELQWTGTEWETIKATATFV